MNDFDLVRKNLFRRKLRAILMIVSILIAFMIFGVLAGFYRAFTAGEDRAAADRLITVNKINFTQPLPIAYFNRVRAVDGVRQVTHANWFGGYYQDPKNFMMALAIEPATYFDVYRNDFDIPPEQLQAFIRDRSSAVVGESTGAANGAGRSATACRSRATSSPRSSGGHTWDFTIVGIVKGKAEHVDTNFMLFQYDYFDETRSFGKDTIGWLILQTTSPENNDRVAKAIDAMFANSTAETSTDTEKAFGKAFAAQFGNIALIVFLVVGAAFVTILMIVGNTMALSIRERTREIGVLKTLGFSGRADPAHGARRIDPAGAARRPAGPGDRRADHDGAARQPRQRRAGVRRLAGHRAAGHRADDRARPDHRDHSGAQCHAAEDRHRARTGLDHALAFAAGDRGHLHQSQEHRAAALAVAVDGDRDRAGGDRAAGVPRHGQRIPAHHRRLRRRRHRHRAAGGLAGGNQQHGQPRPGAPDRGRARASRAAPTASR